MYTISNFFRVTTSSGIIVNIDDEQAASKLAGETGSIEPVSAVNVFTASNLQRIQAVLKLNREEAESLNVEDVWDNIFSESIRSNEHVKKDPTFEKTKKILSRGLDDVNWKEYGPLGTRAYYVLQATKAKTLLDVIIIHQNKGSNGSGLLYLRNFGKEALQKVRKILNELSSKNNIEIDLDMDVTPFLEDKN